MIEDGKHIFLFHAYSEELQAVLIAFNERMNGVTDKQELVKLHLEREKALIAVLEQQRRAVDFMIGNKVQPQMHFGEAALTGVGSLV